MTVYRPSARVRLTIRAEELGDTAALVARLPDPFAPGATCSAPAPAATTTPRDDSAADALARNQDRLRALERRRASLSAEEYSAQLRDLTYERQDILEAQRQDVSEQSSAAPESVLGVADDGLTVLGQITPRSVQIERHGLATADTCTILLDYADAPIDPRVVRAAAVEVVLGVVPADDYESGMERGETRPDGSLRSVIGVSDDGVLRGATRFVGFVDSWEVEYGEDGDTISLECRDASAPLRDLPLPTGASVDLSLPIDEGVQHFLDTVSATTRGVTVVWDAEGTPPVPGAGGPQRRRPRRGQVQRRARRGGEQLSLWDHLTDVVRGLGLLPVVRGWDVALIDPRTLYSSATAVRMVYGRNLSKLSFSRKLMGVKVPTIEVRSFDPERGRTLWARYPVAAGQRASGVLGLDEQPGPTRANQVPPSGSNPDEAVRVMSVSGVTDTALLERVARGAFEQLGRQELEGQLETADAWSYDVAPDEADLLALTAGDAVELLLARAGSPEDEAAGSATTLATLQAMDRRRRADYMVGLGWDRSVAERFAALQDATGFQTTFRVQDVRLSWDGEEGLKVGVTFINFITIREEAAS